MNAIYAEAAARHPAAFAAATALYDLPTPTTVDAIIAHQDVIEAVRDALLPGASDEDRRLFLCKAGAIL